MQESSESADSGARSTTRERVCVYKHPAISCNLVAAVMIDVLSKPCRVQTHLANSLSLSEVEQHG
jgi:hypothetical protein